ncbi:MAG: ATP synthase F0 subunit B [Desulfobacterales bacterium]|nr:ATP synthase F0 subunit B [Desulfobacterales bacterium]
MICRRMPQVPRHLAPWAAGLMLIMLATGGNALAAGDAHQWRPTYDLAMRWINFVILVSLLIKYGRGPLKNFLGNQKSLWANHLLRLETEKAKAEKEVAEAKAALAASDARMETLRQRLLQEGKREKAAIIEAARIQARMMLVGAERQTQTRILGAKSVLRAEMVDMAMDAVLATLPDRMTDSDNRRWTNRFVSSISAP